MIEEDRETLRSVAWSELFPWLLLFRCFRVSIGIRPLLLSAAAAVATVAGWSLIGALFSGNEEVAAQHASYAGNSWNRLASVAEQRPGTLAAAVPDLFDRRAPIAARHFNPVLGSWEHLSRPFVQIYTMNSGADSEPRISKAAYSLLCGLWGLLIWTFAGAMVTRDAAVQLGAGGRIGWSGAIAHARRCWKACFWAPLLPLVAILLAVAMMGLFGMVMRLNLGVFVAGALWPLLLVGGFLTILLLVGLLFGWPLMFATIGTEGTDSFDALSRTYAYVFQRPLHYLFYIAVATVVGVLGWILVSGIAQAVLGITFWATGWGSGGRFLLVADPWPHLQYHFAGGEPVAHLGAIGDLLIRFWSDCVRLLAVGYLYSYFWVSATAAYLLLRRNVDDTELDEVYLEDEGHEHQFGLPEIVQDEAGAPVVQADAPPEPTE